MKASDVNVSLTISDDKTVMVLVLTGNEAIEYEILAEVLKQHVDLIRSMEMTT